MRTEKINNLSLIRKFYRKLVLVRSLELLLIDLFSKKFINHALCSGMGQEAGGVAFGSVLKREDILLSSPRGFSYAIGKGLNLRVVLSEVIDKKWGTGNRFLADPSKGIFGFSQSMGATFALAVGLALAVKRKKEKRIVACVFGDGAASRGTFHGALNLSKIWRLPILWICENNQFSFSVPFDKISSTKDVAAWADNYNMPAFVIDGNDALVIYKAARRIIEKVRVAQSPAFIELKTYRCGGHFWGDPNSFLGQESLAPSERPEFIYEKEEDIRHWLSRSPLRILGAKLRLGKDAAKKDIAKTVRLLRNYLSLKGAKSNF